MRVEPDQHRTAADVDVVLQHEGDGLRAERLLHRPVEGPDLLHRGREAGGECDDFLPDAHDAARNLPAETAEIMERGVGGVIGPVDPLHGQAKPVKIPIARDVNRLEMTEQRRADIPRSVRRGLDDVVPVERTHRDEFHVLDIEAREKFFELRPDLEEARLAPADEVHLVHGHDEVRDAEKRGDRGVTAALLDHAKAGIDEHDGEIGQRGARHHVARVLDVARSVRDDELPARRRKVAVGDVDRDALLALGAKTVGEVGEIDLPAAGDVGRAFERLDLIFHQRF